MTAHGWGSLYGEVEMAPKKVWVTARVRVWLSGQRLAVGKARGLEPAWVLAKGLEWADETARSSEEGLGSKLGRRLEGVTVHELVCLRVAGWVCWWG